MAFVCRSPYRRFCSVGRWANLGSGLPRSHARERRGRLSVGEDLVAGRMRYEAERCMPKLPVLRLLFALLLATIPVLPSSAADRPAADAGAAPLPPLGTLTPEQANALIARLSDVQVRELLLQQLDRRTPEPGASASGADAVFMVADRAQTIRYRLGEMVAAP